MLKRVIMITIIAMVLPLICHASEQSACVYETIIETDKCLVAAWNNDREAECLGDMVMTLLDACKVDQNIIDEIIDRVVDSTLNDTKI